VRRLADGIWQLESAGRVANVHLVEAEEPVLVDAGTKGRGPKVLAELQAHGTLPARIVVTHGDFDHVGAAAFLARELGIAIWAPEADRALLEGRLSRGPVIDLAWKLVGPPRPIPVARWYAAGETLAGIETIPTPGHTPGHTSLKLGSTLVAGDAVVTGEKFKEQPASMSKERARRSVEQLAELDVDLAVSGHGKPAFGAREKLQTLVASWR
jgi:glyoxylase-like metal-dependent hydrolase (beta-lactamase superfamily II)